MGAFLHTSSFSLHDHQPQAETETSLFESEKQQVKLLILSLLSVFLFPSQVEASEIFKSLTATTSLQLLRGGIPQLGLERA